MRKIPVYILLVSLLIMVTGCKPNENIDASEHYEGTVSTLKPQDSVSTQPTENGAPTETPVESIQTCNIFNKDGSVKIDVYINNHLMDTKVFDDNPPPIEGPNNLGNFTLVDPIMDFLDIEYTIDETGNKISLKSEKYGEMDFEYASDVRIVDGQVYLQFYDFRVYTNGSLKQDDYNSMYLYTGDYERTDLPTTLEESYAMLDKILSSKDIEYMENATEKDLAMQHFGLGLWIRNNWLYPTQSKLTKLLLDNGLDHPDNMSGLILKGYVKYLNGEPCSLEDLLG